MSDDPVDDIARKRREQRHRERHREFVDTMQSANDIIEDGANAFLDHRDAIDRLKQWLIGSLKNGMITVSGIRSDGDPLDLNKEIAEDESGETGAMLRSQAAALIEARAERLATPDLRIVVVPLDGDPPDPIHRDVVDRHANAILYTTEPEAMARVMDALNGELRDLARPALAVKLSDEMVHDFFFPEDGDGDDDGPAS